MIKRFSLMTRRNCIRRFFIYGVLAGLFFSGGEGVRLMPFPAADNVCSNHPSSIENIEKNLKSYILSVHNSGNPISSLKSKFQKQTGQYLSGGRLIFDSFNAKAFQRQCKPNQRESALFRLSRVPRFQSDRAPPAV